MYARPKASQQQHIIGDSSTASGRTVFLDLHTHGAILHVVCCTQSITDDSSIDNSNFRN